jgi:SsrA-binding protein
MAAKVREKGVTVVPTAMILSGRWIKVEISLATGKKLHDKRDALRERTLDREAQQAVKEDR